MAKGKDYYGDRVADVIAGACKELSVSQEELDIEVLETGSSGIFGLCKKKAHIRVNRKSERAAEGSEKAENATKSEPAEKSRGGKNKKQKQSEPEKTARADQKSAPKPDRKQELNSEKTEKAAGDTPAPAPTNSSVSYEPPSAEALAAVQSDISAMLELMGFPSKVTVALENQTVACRISEDHQDVLVGQDGRTLDSLQYLLRKMTSKQLPDRTKLSMDVGDYRERRVAELKEQALELAAKVKEDGMTQAIPALNPSERRQVHMVLQDDKSIRSRSVGDGLFKKVLIYKPGRKKSYPRKSRGRQGGSSGT